LPFKNTGRGGFLPAQILGYSQKFSYVLAPPGNEAALVLPNPKSNSYQNPDNRTKGRHINNYG
jgi:hypothetical protein